MKKFFLYPVVLFFLLHGALAECRYRPGFAAFENAGNAGNVLLADTGLDLHVPSGGSVTLQAGGGNASGSSGEGCTADFYYYIESNGVTCTKVSFYSFHFSSANVYYWDFGDGATSTQKNPVHVFDDYGVYNVCLTIDDTANQCYDVKCYLVKLEGGATNILSGYVFYDLNGNGEFDMNEPGVKDRLVKIDPGSIYSATNTYGHYEAHVDTGTFTFTSLLSKNWVFTGEDTFRVTFTGCNEISYDNNFAIRLNPNLKDLFVTLTRLTPARPGFDVYYDIDYRNLGGDTVNFGVLTFHHDNLLSYVSGTPSENSYATSSQTASWYFYDLAPAQARKIRVRLSLPATVAAGIDLKSSATVEPLSGDADISDNSDTVSQEVTSSFSSNVKQVSPKGSGSEGLIKVSEKLTYTIYFQNVGTDTAFNAWIVDTLDEDLDFSSFEMLSSSHDRYSLLTTGKDWEITWVHGAVKLPDSTVNWPESHGFVKYSVLPHTHLATGTRINNTAHIYFDFNPPVATNTTLNTIDGNASVGFDIEKSTGRNVFVYPNPLHETATVVFKNPEGKQYHFVVADLTGREVMRITGKGSGHFPVSKGSLVKGLYFYYLVLDERIMGHGKITVH